MDDQFVKDEKEQKPWDKYFASAPPKNAKADDGWQLLHDGRTLEASLIASQGELVSDLLWGNLALPITKTIEKLTLVEKLYAKPAYEGGPPCGPDGLSEEDQEAEADARRECRAVLELSVAQLEEMQEKKGEFGNEYRVVVAAWYMLMLPWTRLSSPLMAPVDASKTAWEFQEGEYERRRVEGAARRKQREEAAVFDVEAAKLHPYEFVQTKRRYEMTLHIPIPAKTQSKDVRVTSDKHRLRVVVAQHPLCPIIDGAFYREVHASEGSEPCCWHIDGEYEQRRLVIDMEKAAIKDWPCLLLADAPPEPPPVPRKVVSGAAGEVDVYAETANLERPKATDKFFSWGAPPNEGKGSTGAKSVWGTRQAPPAMVASKEAREWASRVDAEEAAARVAAAEAAGGEASPREPGSTGSDELSQLLSRLGLGGIEGTMRDEGLEDLKLLRSFGPTLLHNLGEIGISEADALRLQAGLAT